MLLLLVQVHTVDLLTLKMMEAVLSATKHQLKSNYLQQGSHITATNCNTDATKTQLVATRRQQQTIICTNLGVDKASIITNVSGVFHTWLACPGFLAVLGVLNHAL